MKLTKRSFFAAFAAAPVAARSMAQQIVQPEALRQCGVGSVMARGASAAQPPGSHPFARALKAGLVKREELREMLVREAYVNALEPDLAVNRSLSLAAKFRLQRERQAERTLRECLDTPFSTRAIVESVLG